MTKLAPLRYDSAIVDEEDGDLVFRTQGVMERARPGEAGFLINTSSKEETP